MNDCIFCKIASKELPSYTIFEDDDVLSFLDIRPVHPGHSLVISKRHDPDFLALDQEAIMKMMGTIARIGRAVKTATGADGLNITTNVGAAAGQEVFHVHWHIIPRFTGDGLRRFPQQEYASKEEAFAALSHIKSALAISTAKPA
ncbi:HIT family protein [Candidatus Uhrbacteria bacterium]|nr:HIT family protein [Candidatus Uhrbacteria bacterium]